jgi:hypothetical protein
LATLNPFPKEHARSEQWLTFSNDVSAAINHFEEERASVHERLKNGFNAVKKASPSDREVIWREVRQKLPKPSPDANWTEAVPTDESIDHFLANFGQEITPLLAVIDTFAQQALATFVHGSEDIGSWKRILQYLGDIVVFAMGSVATKDVRIGIQEQLERWEDSGIGSIRAWNIRPTKRVGIRADQKDHRLKDYERCARHVADAMGLEVEHDFQAVDALLEDLSQYLVEIKSPQARDFAIRSLCIVTWEYCSEVRTRALKDGRTAEADFFGDIGQRFRNLRGTELDGDLVAYRRVDEEVARIAVAKLKRSQLTLNQKAILPDEPRPPGTRPATPTIPVAPTRKPSKRSKGYEAIDNKLKEIAKSVPKDHEEVFKALDGRVNSPNCKPFSIAGGWMAGFKKNPHAARSWLSKAWSKLGLPAFQRGPK